MHNERRLAVITGAASGLGLQLTQQCLERNMNVVMADCNKDLLIENSRDLQKRYDARILALEVDLRHAEQVVELANQVFKQFSRVDWLINNAGVSGPLGALWTLKASEIRDVMDINLFGAIHTIQAFFPMMFKQKQASHLINICSVFGLCASSLLSAYAMSKHALIALSESLYFDLLQMNKQVKVSVVCPSFIQTALLENSRPQDHDAIHELMASVMDYSRPAKDVAQFIVEEVEKEKFYIFPDKEVKSYHLDKSKAMLEEQNPDAHNLEKLIHKLSKRAETQNE